MAEKTIASKAGFVQFDGVDGIKLPIAELLDSPSTEPTGKAILVMNHRKVVTLHDVKDENGNYVTVTVTLRAERSPMNQGEAEAVVNKRLSTEANKDKREQKEQAANQRLIDAVQATAIKVAQSSVSQNAGSDPVALAFKIAAGMSGQKSLTSGQ